MRNRPPGFVILLKVRPTVLNRADPVHADAIDWIVRLRDGNESDWEAFTLWLEASPEHSDVYAAAAMADADLEPVLRAARAAAPRGANDDEPVAGQPFWRRFALGSTGIAAAVAALLVFGGPDTAASRYAVGTAAGQHRTIGLGNGSQIVMNGSSRMTLDRADARYASLDSGEATFTIRHDPSAPFRLELGPDRLVDVGTVFNVVREVRDVRVAVSEGAVLFNPGKRAIALTAGQVLHASATGTVVTRVDPATIGSWQSGRLVYRDTPLAVVAGDLSRNLGTPVSVTPAVASQAFTGSIQIDRDAPRFFSRLELLLGVKVDRGTDGWQISAGRRSDS